MSNAIVYLLNNAAKDILFFRNSIYLLNRCYLDQYPCDVVCLHEADFPREEMENIKRISSAPIQFVPIKFEVPAYSPDIASRIPEFVPHPEISSVPGFPMGYRYMCRFFAGEVFSHPALQEYKYVWRLDTDSLILSPINYDVFRRMAESKAKYGYINIQFDHPKMTVGLWPLATKYFADNRIVPLVDINAPQHENRVFYTNFEIFDMDWFKSPAYQNYYKCIDDNGGIFISRWGDHCIRYIAVKSLLTKEETLFFHDINYFHSREFYNQEILDSHG